MSAELTDKEARFVEEYLIDLNATQAAIRAGYSKDAARNIALVVWDRIWNAKPRERVWFRYPGMWLLIGEAAGLLWSQTP